MNKYTNVKLTGKELEAYIAERFNKDTETSVDTAPVKPVEKTTPEAKEAKGMSTTDTIKAYESDTGSAMECETEELLEYPRDLRDASHEHADGHEDVIYYSKAHECVKNANSDEAEHAEQTMTDCCCYEDSPSYDTIATRLAYWIIDYRYTNEVTADLDGLKDWIESQEDEDEHAKALEAIEAILA